MVPPEELIWIPVQQECVGHFLSFHLFESRCCIWCTALATGRTIKDHNPKGLQTLTMFTYMKQLTTGLRLKLPSKNIRAEFHLTTQRVRIWSRPVAEQLVLERCGSATDVHVWDGFDEERPLGDAEALHLAPSLVLLAQQQAQLAVAVQVDVGASGVRRGFDADRETGGGRGEDVGPEINDDGPGGVKPLQGALRAAQVHLLHVPGMAFVHQTAERKEQERHEQNAQQTRIIQRRINGGQRPRGHKTTFLLEH